MEQWNEEYKPQEQPQTPQRCPRCGSLNTAFRYFNNYSHTQPRYYCRMCKRLWTLGGNLRHVPFGGRPRNGKQTKPSPSGSQPLQLPLPLEGKTYQNTQVLAPMGATTVAQNFETTILQQAIDTPAAVSPVNICCYFDDDISGLDAVQTLIEPEFMNQPVNSPPKYMNQPVSSGNQISICSENMDVPQNWNVQTMLSEEVLPQQISLHNQTDHIHNQANNFPSYSYNNVVQPTLLVCSLIQDNFSTSNDLWNQRGGSSSERESDTSSVNVDEWLDFSSYDSS